MPVSLTPTGSHEAADGPEISVVVCTRDRAPILADCLESLLEQELPGRCFEVLVIDDGSSDDTVDVVERLAGRVGEVALRCHRQPPSGLNAARNAGLELARGRAIGFVDDDELAPEGYLSRAAALLAAHPRVAGVGGPCREYHRPGPRTCRRCSLAAVDLHGAGRRSTARLLGGNMIVRRETFERVGWFDAALSGRGDENEWFWRAGEHELEFLFDPDLWLWHRRDHMTAAALCRLSFHQGRSIPLERRRTRNPWRPSPCRVARALGHALTFRCTQGAVRASRELGATWTWLGRPFRAGGGDSAAGPAG